MYATFYIIGMSHIMSNHYKSFGKQPGSNILIGLVIYIQPISNRFSRLFFKK